MKDHYIVVVTGDHGTTACGQRVPLLPVPPAGSDQCGTCVTLADTMDRVA